MSRNVTDLGGLVELCLTALANESVKTTDDDVQCLENALLCCLQKATWPQLRVELLCSDRQGMLQQSNHRRNPADLSFLIGVSADFSVPYHCLYMVKNLKMVIILCISSALPHLRCKLHIRS